MSTSDMVCGSFTLRLNSKQEDIGTLQKPTAGHAVIETIEDQFLVVGGDAKITQKCYLDENFQCQFHNSIGTVCSSPFIIRPRRYQ